MLGKTKTVNDELVVVDKRKINKMHFSSAFLPNNDNQGFGFHNILLRITFFDSQNLSR